MENVNDVIGYEEHLRDEATHYDYISEAFGDRCPGCKTFRWGGDCPRCFDDVEFEMEFTNDELDRMSLDSLIDSMEAK